MSGKMSTKAEIVSELKRMCNKKTMFQNTNTLLNKVNHVFVLCVVDIVFFSSV